MHIARLRRAEKPKKIDTKPAPESNYAQHIAKSKEGFSKSQTPSPVISSPSNAAGASYNAFSSNASVSTASGSTSSVIDDDEEFPLEPDERVVWLSDRGPEFGIVRWIGRLPDLEDEVTVGVEFVSIRKF